MQSIIRSGRVLTVALLFAVLIPVTAHARFDGIARNGSGCGNCHGNTATASLNVTVAGPSTLGVNATGSYTLTIDMVDAGGGFSLSADTGTLMLAAGSNTQFTNSNITHVDSGGVNLGQWSYDFDFMAPGALGTATFAFSGLAHDNSGTADKNAADFWNVGTFAVSIVPEPGTGLLVSLGLGMLVLAGRRRR